MGVGGRRLAGIGLALLLGLGLALTPATSREALAADPLRVHADATYTLDPAGGRVHVVVDVEVTDLKPNSARFIYYYTGYWLAIQREARSIRASDSGGALSVTTRTREFYVQATVDFRKNLYYRQTAKFKLRYDLVGGAPRSTSPIRVGRAFATFGVWAWGDPGKGSVAVHLPLGFFSELAGDPMSIERSGGGEILRAKPADPGAFYAIVSAENSLAYTADRLSLEGGVEIVVKAWPEDERWEETVGETLRAAMPKLRELIGLDWPVAHDLNIRERYTPALEGYAGIFFQEEQRIDVSEDLDPVIIVHEASHAWFNDLLFSERWIYEGLAQEYAWRVQQAVGGDDGGAAAYPDPNDPGYVLLHEWTFPRVIRDQETDDRERYGYQASFWVIHNVVTAVGVEHMREVFASADAQTTAYPGAGRAEAVPRAGWKTFLDLVERIERPDSLEFDDMLRDLVLTPGEADQLADRATARKAYRALLDAGDGWLPGWYVRRSMGEWRFDVAQSHIAEAQTVLDLRGQVDAAAAALELEPNGALRDAYEGAQAGFADATAVAQAELDALSAIADARTKVEAEPDLVSTIGLLGETPDAPYAAARGAFEGGDMAMARTSALAAAALVTGAAAVGQGRLAIAIGIAVALLLLVIVMAVLVRRRRRRAVALAAGATFETVALEAGAPEPGAPEPAPGEPYATLAADPGAAPAPVSEHPPDTEGGPATRL
jgi:hypothetical protein